MSGTRGRQEPAEPAAVRLASMVSLLPGVHGSRQSEGRGSGAVGAVVALVEPDKVQVCVYTICVFETLPLFVVVVCVGEAFLMARPVATEHSECSSVERGREAL